MSDNYDVILVGGGPAGAACGTMLAREGFRVMILERAKFPRFHIGESLTAFAADAFKKLGVYEELKEINYVQKRGLEFVLPDKSTTVYFPEDMRNEPDDTPWAFQMARPKLDSVLLSNAERSGAVVRQQHAVQEVLFENDRAVGVEYKDVSDKEAQPEKAFAKWIVDTTGQSGCLNRQFKSNCLNDALLDDKLAVFSHWSGDIGISNGKDIANFKLCVHPNRRDWAWFLPIDRDVVSLGVVLDKRSVKQRGKSLEECFYEHAREIPFVAEFLDNPTLERTEQFRGVKDFSYRAKQVYGPGWALTGDAAAFLDPIFSTGMQIALNSSFQLADALTVMLRQETPDDSPLEEYAEFLDRIYRINATLVYWFYECGIDPERARSAWALWSRTKWAGLKYRLQFLWHGARVIFRPRKVILTWGREVLFGNVRRGNQIAELFLVLARNYEELYGLKAKERVRTVFNDM